MRSIDPSNYATRRHRLRSCGALAALFAGVGFGAALPAFAADVDDLPRYVGWQACAECHQAGGHAAPCSLKPIPEHASTIRLLLREEASHIAALTGEGRRPLESRLCLGCHSTGADSGRRWHADTFNPADGVRCEACHGAGSLHVNWARSRADAAKESPAQTAEPEQAPKAGGPFTAPFIRRSSRAECSSCHRSLDSHQVVSEGGFRLSPADDRYRTPLNLLPSPNGKRLYVVCSQSNSLVVLDWPQGRVLNEIPVGSAPQDLALSPDGRRLHVSNRLAGTVSVIDTASLEVIREVTTGAEPHGMITDPTGQRLFVLNTGQNSISALDLAGGTEQYRLVAGQGPWAVAADGENKLAYITSVRPSPVPFREPPRSEITVLDLALGRVVRRLDVPEANMLQGIAAVPGRNLLLFTLMRTKNLLPITRLGQGWVITNGLGLIRSDGRVDQVLLDEPAHYFPDPTGVAVSPDGRWAAITSGGVNEVAIVDISRLIATVDGLSDEDRRDLLPNHLGFSQQFVVTRVAVGRNPRGLAFSPDGRHLFVANALDDSISVLGTGDWTLARTILLGGPAEVSVIRRGQRLFHSADITFGRQFSCASCHPDGHLNGLTHDIEADGAGIHPVDNRTLRGILDTAPFKWEGTNPSLHRQCGARLSVFFTRQAPFTPEELEALVWYESVIPLPPNPHRERDGLTPAQYRGKLVFEREVDNTGQPIPANQRCSTCHNSPYFTNRQVTPLRNAMWFDFPIQLQEFDLHDYDEFGDHGMLYYLETGAPLNEFDVPHMTNIHDGGPYLHNGAAQTLEEVWTRFNATDDHGRTSDLTREQFNDLMAYLRAL